MGTFTSLNNDINMRDNINTIKKNIKALIDASKEVGLEIITEKSTSICRFNSIQFNLFHPRIIIHDMGQVKD
jgi:hypothetical protein